MAEPSSEAMTITPPPLISQRTELFRTYPQCLWLYTKLQEKYAGKILLPPFPDPPTATDADYMEKKRLQMERFFGKLVRRKHVVEESKDLAYFVSESMTSLDVKPVQAAAAATRPVSPSSSMLGGMFQSDYRQGFRVFPTLPPGLVQDPVLLEDVEEFERRKAYILQLEGNFVKLLEAFATTVRNEEALAKALHQLGYAFKEHLSVKPAAKKEASPAKKESSSPPPALTLEDLEWNADLDRFYQLLTARKAVQAKENRDEILRFGDVILEYKNSIRQVRQLMNLRTDKLLAVVEAIKMHKARVEKLEKAKGKLAETSAELQLYKDEEQKALLNVEDCRKEFLEAKSVLTRELVQFEKEKRNDMIRAVRAFGRLQIDYGQRKVDLFQKAIAKEEIRTD